MSERCRECQKRPARRRGLCVYCVRAADDQRYVARIDQKVERYRTSELAVARRKARNRREHEKHAREKALIREEMQKQHGERSARELAALVAAQERDMKWGSWLRRTRSVISLDLILADGEGNELHEVFGVGAAQSAEDEYLGAETSKAVEALVACLPLDDAERLDGPRVDWLQDRLRELDVPLPRVQRKERARLRTPPRHRGEAPPPMFQRMTSRRRKRRAQIAAMSGKRTSRKRTSRKQRGRWNREKVVY